MRKFTEGWAVKGDGLAHYFYRDGAGLCTSICGAQDAAAGWLSEPGNREHCARCDRIMLKDYEARLLGAAEVGDGYGDHS